MKSFIRYKRDDDPAKTDLKLDLPTKSLSVYEPVPQYHVDVTTSLRRKACYDISIAKNLLVKLLRSQGLDLRRRTRHS